MKKLYKGDELRWFVTLIFSMSASYDFGDNPLSGLPSSNNFRPSSEGLLGDHLGKTMDEEIDHSLSRGLNLV